MVGNLFAACRVEGHLSCKRVRLSEDVQQDVEDLFERQEQEFRRSYREEVPFTGDWKPDEDQVFTVDAPIEAESLVDVVTANAFSVDEMNQTSFADEGIKALFTGSQGSGPVLVQRFTAQQLLEKKLALVGRYDAFGRLSDPAFTLDTSLACIIENGALKFKSYQKLRSIFDMTGIYREATDQEVREFAMHHRLEVTDVEEFLSGADQTVRKLIHGIRKSNVLEDYSAEQISRGAEETGVAVEVANARIVIPGSLKERKEVLEYLTRGASLDRYREYRTSQTRDDLHRSQSRDERTRVVGDGGTGECGSSMGRGPRVLVGEEDEVEPVRMVLAPCAHERGLVDQAFEEELRKGATSQARNDAGSNPPSSILAPMRRSPSSIKYSMSLICIVASGYIA